MSLSDSASNGTGTPPPPQSLPCQAKTVKTGKIYKPKFHTALHCATNDADTSSSLSANGLAAKPNAEQLQEHIDRIITDNQAIVEAVDPRLYKLMQQRQASVTETRDQPLNLSSVDEPSPEKRRKCDDETVDESKDVACGTCKITFASNDNLETHRR